MQKDLGSFKPYLGPMGAWALSFGCTIGWGAFLIPGTSFLPSSGLMGSLIGLAAGAGIMLVIARNYHTLIIQHPKAGGTFSATRHMLNFDHGLLCGWFLCLTYLGIIWANCSAIALLARYTLGKVFMKHYLYKVAGYDIYLEEVLLCMAAMALAGCICLWSKKISARGQIIFVLILASGLAISFLFAIKAHPARQTLEPMFLPESPAWLQVVRAFTIMPWAFVGFESLSHSAEEFTFSPRLSFRIMALSILMSTAAYVVMLLTSVLILPPEFPNWLAYVKSLNILQGIKSVPTFSAMRQAMGNPGVVLLGFTMLGGLFSSLVGNLICLSRLVTVMAEKEILPSWLGKRTSKGIPQNAILAIMATCLFIPFLGRTAIGWNVDVSNIGATIAYAYTSLDAYRYSRVAEDKRARFFGALGILFSTIFLILLLLPNHSLSTESFLILSCWIIMGFELNYRVFKKDQSGGYGRSATVWIVLACLTLYTTSSFIWQSSQTYSQKVAQAIKSHYMLADALQDTGFVDQQLRSYHNTQMRNYIIGVCLLLIAIRVLLATYTEMNRRKLEKEKILGEVSVKAFKDKLTGAQSINAYRDKESTINSKIANGTISPFALIVCDVNNLKKVNDEQGHQAGDDYLRSAYQMLRDVFTRASIYRVGGDEFVVLLEAEDCGMQEKLLNDLETVNLLHRQAGKVQIAAGISNWTPKDELLDTVFSRADICMYKKKSEMKKSESPTGPLT